MNTCYYKSQLCSWHVIGRIAVKFSSRLVACLCNSAGNTEV